jgi:hypothetical protein
MAKKRNSKPAKARVTRKSKKPAQSAAGRRKLPTHETLMIYRPDDFALDVKKLFPKEAKDWKDAASDQGFLRIRPDVRLGIVGLYGSLALGNPPSPVDLLDHWEASKPKDCWDYWSLFDFISVPAEGKKGGLDVVIFHSQDSFQEKPLEVAHRIHLPKAVSELFVTERHDYTEFNDLDEKRLLAWHWARLRGALQARFGSSDLRQQKWSVQGNVYDVTYPDD